MLGRLRGTKALPTEKAFSNSFLYVICIRKRKLTIDADTSTDAGVEVASDDDNLTRNADTDDNVLVYTHHI